MRLSVQQRASPAVAAIERTGCDAAGAVMTSKSSKRKLAKTEHLGGAHRAPTARLFPVRTARVGRVTVISRLTASAFGVEAGCTAIGINRHDTPLLDAKKKRRTGVRRFLLSA